MDIDPDEDTMPDAGAIEDSDEEGFEQGMGGQRKR
jgi:hypothetical protein